MYEIGISDAWPNKTNQYKIKIPKITTKEEEKYLARMYLKLEKYALK